MHHINTLCACQSEAHTHSTSAALAQRASIQMRATCATNSRRLDTARRRGETPLTKRNSGSREPREPGGQAGSAPSAPSMLWLLAQITRFILYSIRKTTSSFSSRLESVSSDSGTVFYTFCAPADAAATADIVCVYVCVQIISRIRVINASTTGMNCYSDAVPASVKLYYDTI